jgi:hypothetical protein
MIPVTEQTEIPVPTEEATIYDILDFALSFDGYKHGFEPPRDR